MTEQHDSPKIQTTPGMIPVLVLILNQELLTVGDLHSN